jgi:hemerythrin-like metal-binding protein
MSIEWQDAYKIGNAEADASKKALFELANEIIAEDDWIALRPKIIALFKQMQKQFDMEDALMAQVSYPEAKVKAHAEAHHQFLMRLRDRSMDVGKGHMNKKAIVGVMTDWAEQHVTTDDVQLAQALAVSA